MQQRMHLDHPGEEVRRAVPVTYLIFDLLGLDGNDTTSLTYEQRRKLLVDLVEPGPAWQVPAHHTGDGTALLAAATAKGLEGLMAKRLDSPYVPGRRSPAWRKIKVRREQEVVVVGWLPGEGNRSGLLGALLAGVHDPSAPDRPLRFAGRVGTGFSEAELRRLGDRLAELATPTSPLAPPVPREIARLARWVRPELVAQVAFGEWTPDGRMRHPSYLGLRMDKDPSDVVREGI
jgi:bifunctional non-homologous end joining protein LigD